MSNPFYGVGRWNNMAAMLQQLKSNPMNFLMQRRFNIPQEIMNDPNAILNHLLSTGQISQGQVNAAYQAGQQFRRM